MNGLQRTSPLPEMSTARARSAHAATSLTATGASAVSPMDVVGVSVQVRRGIVSDSILLQFRASPVNR